MSQRTALQTHPRRRGTLQAFIFSCVRYRSLLLMLLPGVIVFLD